MSLWKIAWRSIQERALSSTLTGMSMALGVALVVTVLVVLTAVQESFSKNGGGYDLVVGAKGSRLQLVLNTVFHLDRPIENIPYSYYKEFTEGKFAQYVAVAVPYCLGDQYEGFRVVGTTNALFEKFEYARDQGYEFTVGRNFAAEAFFESVIGATVAKRTGLKVGDTFQPSHGVVDDDQGHEHDPFTVVGILAPTGTANDRALFVNIEGFYLLEGHAKGAVDEDPGPPPSDAAELLPLSVAEANVADPHDESAAHDEGGEDHHHAHEPLPEELREVTAILILTSHGIMGAYLPGQINEGQVAQAVFPVKEVTELFENIVGPVKMLLLCLAILVIVVAGIGIMVSIYNSMSDRKREIAIMRALGARRETVMTIILFESILLSLAGGAVGVILGHGLVGAISPFVEARTSVAIGALAFAPKAEFLLIPSLVVLASLVGLLPAIAAYRTEVDQALSASP